MADPEEFRRVFGDELADKFELRHLIEQSIAAEVETNDYRQRPPVDEPRIMWLNWPNIIAIVSLWVAIAGIGYLVCVLFGLVS